MDRETAMESSAAEAGSEDNVVEPTDSNEQHRS